MKMISLNHIGIAIKDLGRSRELLEILGLRSNHIEDVPEQGVKTHFFPVNADGMNLEILEPVDPAGVVARFVSSHGPGIHHLSFKTEKGELDPLLEKLRSRGFRLVYGHPKRGAHGMRINFIHPSSTGGLLIEMMESI